MKITLTQSLVCAIGLGEKELISIVGAGGKTSTMYALARELACAGRKVLSTTTTRIFYPSGEQADCVLIGDEDQSTIDDIKDGLSSSGVMVAGRERVKDKVIGFSTEFVDRLYRSLSDWQMIVESDGARGMSFKIPEEHEPPLAQSTSICAILIGADSLGKPLDSGYVYKPELVSQRLGVSQSTNLNIDLVLRSLEIEGGYLERIPSKARVCIMLNKVLTRGSPWEYQNPMHLLLAYRLRRNGRVKRVIMGCFGEKLNRSFMVVE